MATLPVLSHPLHSSSNNSPFHKATHSATPVRKTKPINRNKLELEEAMNSLEDYPSERGRRSDDRQAFYNSLISLCISRKGLREGNRLRSHMARIGYNPGLFLENQFINLYAKCGVMDMARELFNGMRERNVVSWNAMIAGYCSTERFLDAFLLFRTMIEAGQNPNQLTYLSTLRASVGSRNLKHGEQIHASVIKAGFLPQTEVGNSLINMYSKLGSLENAEAVYKSMVERDEVSWNSIIDVNARKGCGDRVLALFVEMQKEGFVPNEYTFGSLLGSKDIITVEELHSQITKWGFGKNVFIGSALLDAYARSRNPGDACRVFNTIPEQNTIAWNSVISVCFGSDQVHEGFNLYLQMGERGLLPDEYTISILLKAATTQLSIFAGKQIHGLAIKMGLYMDALIGNNLITMYAKHEEIPDSWRAFKNISEPDLISWNSMLQAFVHNEKFEQALILLREMKDSGTEPDEISFVSALAACASLAWHKTGREVHSYLIKTGLVLDAFVGSALVDMYGKSMAITDAKQVFDGIENKDLIIWNSLIVGFAQNGYVDEVLNLLCLMREENLEPDHFTFTSILAVCANTAAMQQGRQIHALILKSELNIDAAVANSLITMYSRIGSIKEAEKVFSKLIIKNRVSWTAMVGGYVQSGYSKEALQLFDRMENSGVIPNGKTFVAVLTACSYAGLAEKAVEYFEMMPTKYGIIPGCDHCACMVDILGRAGKLKEAEDFMKEMPYEPDALVWRMLLSASRIHGDVDRGKRSTEKILALEPGDSAAYVLLSNLYASLGNWEGVAAVRQMMREKGVKKEPGKSWIEVHNQVHEFTAGDHSHPQTDEIHSKLRELFKQMKVEGYVSGIGTCQ